MAPRCFRYCKIPANKANEDELVLASLKLVNTVHAAFLTEQSREVNSLCFNSQHVSTHLQKSPSDRSLLSRKCLEFYLPEPINIINHSLNQLFETIYSPTAGLSKGGSLACPVVADSLIVSPGSCSRIFPAENSASKCLFNCFSISSLK